MPTISLSDIKLYYEEHGNGEPIVLIPGLSAGLWIWFKQTLPLSRHFRVITFDPRGIGRSSISSQPITIRLLADDVAALLRGLEIKQAHILGASFGGFVAQEFALAYPEMTRSVSLCCTSFGGPNHVAPSMETLVAATSTNGFNTKARVRRMLLPAFSREFVLEHPDEVDQIVNMRLTNTLSEGVYRSQLSAAIGFNIEPRVQAIEAPTLVLSGEADKIVPVQNARNLAARIRGADLRIIGGGSHLFFIERSDEFNRLLSEFIESVSRL